MDAPGVRWCLSCHWDWPGATKACSLRTALMCCRWWGKLTRVATGEPHVSAQVAPGSLHEVLKPLGRFGQRRCCLRQVAKRDTRGYRSKETEARKARASKALRPVRARQMTSGHVKRHEKEPFHRVQDAAYWAFHGEIATAASQMTRQARQMTWRDLQAAARPPCQMTCQAKRVF